MFNSKLQGAGVWFVTYSDFCGLSISIMVGFRLATRNHRTKEREEKLGGAASYTISIMQTYNELQKNR